MPEELPAWTRLQVINYEAGFVGLEELAARLGSIVPWDRRGNVFFLDDFESGIDRWFATGSGVGNGVTWSAEQARSGGFSARLRTGNQVDDWSGIYHYLPYYVLSRFGFELSFTHDEDIERYSWDFLLYSGTEIIHARVWYLPASRELQVYDKDLGYVTVATDVYLYEIGGLFNTFKLVVDGETRKYVRIILNQEEYDVSDYSLVLSASVEFPHLVADFMVTTGVADNVDVYVDDVILSQNEP